MRSLLPPRRAGGLGATGGGRFAATARLIIGIDDAGDDRVAHDIGVAEPDEGDAFGAGQDVHGFDEAGAARFPEVDLGWVAGHHAFAVLAKTGEEHEHL